MNNKYQLVSLILLMGSLTLTTHSKASLLKYGSYSIRQEVAQNVADAMWMGADTVKYGDNKVTTLGTNTSLGVGFSDKVQIDFNFIYNRTAASGPDFNMGGVKSGDSLDGIAEVGGRVTRELWSQETDALDLNGYLGIRTPGDKMNKAGSFLAIHDGTTKYDLGLGGFKNLGFMGLGFDLKYIYRPQLHNMTNITLTAPIYIGSGASIGPIMTMVNTYGGYDMSKPEFMAAGMPFADKDEAFTSTGLSGNCYLTETLTLDAYYMAKSSGRNTDKGTTLGLAIGATL